jgi:glycosyltransferase involved in cell wall biosynthesis/SAM-dependent methyltransferase
MDISSGSFSSSRCGESAGEFDGRPVRLLHVATRHVQGGGACNLRHVMQWELEHGYEVHAVFGESGFAPELVPDRVETMLLPELVRKVDPIADAMAYRGLGKLIASLRPAVVQTHHSKAGVLGRLAVRGCTGVVVVHTIHMPSFGPGYPRAASRAFLGAERLCSRFTDLYVAVGSEVRDLYLAAGLGRREQYHVVRAAIDVPSYTSVRELTSGRRQQLRIEFGLPPAGPVCLSLGLLEPRKRHDLLLERVAPLLRAGECVLAIAGDGSERERLENLTAQLAIADRVQFLGHVGDVPGLLGASDLLVHTSLVEGVPQAVLQALMAGLPVVATPSTGIGEAGPHGVLVVDPDGWGLPDAVRSVLAAAPAIPDSGRFGEWTTPSVDRQLETLHSSIRRRREGTRSNVAKESARRSNLDPATVTGFGHQWELFDQAEAPLPDLRRQFERYFRVFPWDEVSPDAVGFDLGCGTGRWARFVAPRVRRLHCIEPSSGALAVARANLAGRPECVFHLASVDAIPLEADSMDFGYSLGVLHHVPDPLAGLRNCVAVLRPGAPFLLYLYYALDQRPWWYRGIFRAADLLRLLICRLPVGVRLAVTTCIAATAYYPAARISRALDRLGVDVERIPLSLYRERSFYSMRTDAFDRFGTRLEKRFSREQMRDLMELAGLEAITISNDPPYWCAVGRKRGSAPSSASVAAARELRPRAAR